MNVTNMPYSHTLPWDGPYKSLVLGAVNQAMFQVVDLQSEFSRKVYTSGVLELDAIQSLRERFVNAGDSLTLCEQEVTLLYTSHYIAACFAADKEAFFQWFLEFENNTVADSEDFRVVMKESQIQIAQVMEESDAWTDVMQHQKHLLEKNFGSLPTT